MDMMAIRRRVLMASKKKELYPIGTDVLTKYIGRDESGKVLYELKRTAFNPTTGQIATSEIIRIE